MAEKKYCPFGFFSFFINKQASQAGGCHHCLESACAFWEEMEDENGHPVEGQCAILSISDSLKMMAAAGSANAVMPREESIVDTLLSTSSSLPPAPPPAPSLMDLFTRAKNPLGSNPLQNPNAAPTPAPPTQNPTPTSNVVPISNAPVAPAPNSPPSPSMTIESSIIESLGIK